MATAGAALSVAEAAVARAETRLLGGHAAPVTALAWSSDAQWLATGSADTTLRLWRADRGSLGKDYRVLRGHPSSVTILAWSPTEPHVLVSYGDDRDRVLRVWDTRGAGRLDAQVSLPTSNVLYVSWRRDGAYLAVGTADDTLTIFDMRGSKPVPVLRESVGSRFGAQLNETAWGPPETGLLFAATKTIGQGVDEGKLMVLQLTLPSAGAVAGAAAAASSAGATSLSTAPAATPALPLPSTASSSSSSSGPIATSATGGASAAAASGASTAPPSGPSTSAPPAPAAAPPPAAPATGSVALVASVVGHTAPALALRFDPAYTYLATGGADSVIALWDPVDLAVVRTFDRQEMTVKGVSFSHDGRLLVAHRQDERTLDIIRVADGSQVRSMPVPEPVAGVAFSPADDSLAYFCDDKLAPASVKYSVRVLLPRGE